MTNRTREEHIEWCKARARPYLEARDYPSAVASMLSDLGSHDETRAAGENMAAIGLHAVMSGSHDFVERFIEGFN